MIEPVRQEPQIPSWGDNFACPDVDIVSRCKTHVRAAATEHGHDGVGISRGKEGQRVDQVKYVPTPACRCMGNLDFRCAVLAIISFVKHRLP